MQKSFEERATQALADPRRRSTDLVTLIADGTELRDQEAAAASQAAADAVNFRLTDADRADAEATADKAKRRLATLTSALEALEARLAEKRATEAERLKADERAAIIRRRDAAAERVAEEWPQLEARAVQLLTMVQESDAEMAAAGLHEASAEAIARGCSGTFRDGVSLIRRLTDLKLPSFSQGHLLAWPAPVQRVDYSEQIRQQRVAAKRAQEAEAALWSRVMVVPPTERPEQPITIMTRRGPTPLGRTAIEAVMKAEHVKDAEAQGCTVTPLRANESVGAPMSAAFL